MKPSLPFHTQFRRWQQSVVVEVEEEVEVGVGAADAEGATKTKTPIIPLRAARPKGGAPSTQIFPLVSGQDVESIISTVEMRTFVLSPPAVPGRMCMCQENEVSTSSVTKK